MKYDIVIIGAGVVGAAIARELSRHNVKILLLEKEYDVAMGTSKANSGIIHAGYNAGPVTLKGQLNVKANPLFDELSRKLKFPFKRIGSLVVGFNQEDLEILQKEKENGLKMGIKGLQIIKKEKLLEMEPNLNPETKYALYAPTAGIISPYEYTIALADNAVINGVNILLETEVTDIITDNNIVQGVRTTKGKIETSIIVNAAGLYSDKIASLVGEDNIKIKPRKGEYHLLDKKWGDFVQHVLFPIPDKHSKGILVTPTVHGNLLIGPNSYPVEEKDDVSVTQEGLEEVYRGARKLVPGLTRNDVIASFSGLRAVAEDDDFIVGLSNKIKGLINVAGIQSPGLSSAPAIAEMVTGMIKDISHDPDIKIDMIYKDDFQEENPERPNFAEYLREDALNEWQSIIKNRKDYGEIICRCEMVTKGEIIDAIKRPVPARSIDAIKRRTRAGGGRCQGGFCGPRVLQILAKELNINPLEVTKKGPGSEILYTDAKELIKQNTKGKNKAGVH